MFEFMKCVVEGIAHVGAKGLLELTPGGKYVYDVGAHAIKRHREKKAQKKLEDDVKEMIGAKADVAFAAAKQAVEEAAPGLSAREKELVTQYVAGIPEAARQSLKRKEDPSGSSLPFGYTIHEPDDVVKLLPQHAPRFVPGEWVPGREDNWRLERRLGGGGFGEVWLARHCINRREKPRAVKFCTNPGARQKLITHEKRLIQRVTEHAGDHPNIVPLLECHLSGETPWLMYEFVDGGTLADTILDWQKLPAPERVGRAITALHTLAGAVGHCHALEPAIIHRDLKPANVLRDAAGTLRVTDFGIGGTAVAVLVAQEASGVRSMIGRLPTLLSGSYSLLYASPQQRNGDKPDPRDDVHALGVIAYQMLTGDLTAAPGRDMDADLSDIGVSDDLIELIGKSVSQKADRRPKDARAWDAVLQKLLERRWLIAVPGKWFSSNEGAISGWKEITSTPAVVTTRLNEIYRFGVAGEVNDTSLKELTHLDGFNSLRELYLCGCRGVTDAGLIHLREFTALRVLDLARTQVTGAGLMHLKGFSELRKLDLTRTEAKDVALEHIRQFSALQELDLNGCGGVTDAGLKFLRELTALRKLEFSACDKITDRGLGFLNKLASLRMLNIHNCAGVTSAGVKELQAALPNCEIKS